MISNLTKAVKIPQLRNKIIFTLAILAFYRFLAHVPVPNTNTEALNQFFQSNQILNLLNVFMGGGLSNLSLVAAGVGPYISASIIIQILTYIVPKLEEIAKDGSQGRQKINQYTRYLTLPIAIIQAYTMYTLISRQDYVGVPLVNLESPIDLILIILAMTAGTYLLIFLGEMITEYGVGQGISVIIFAGILAGLPGSLGGLITISNISQFLPILVFILVVLTVIGSVVYVNEAYRKIEIQYSRRITGGQTFAGGRSYIPIKINQAGVIPIIFAVSLVLIPNFLAGFLQQQSSEILVNIGVWLSTNFSPGSPYYNIFYFLLVFGFTFFYTSIAFNPEKIADDIRKSGGFIPGIRPGKATENYLRYVINRLTLAGGIFLGLIAVMPTVVQSITGIAALSVGGTGVLIVVSVVLETVKQIESQVISREYQSITS